MRCQGCGKKLKDNETVCTECGYYNGEKEVSLEDDEIKNLDYFKDPYDKDEEVIEVLDDDDNEETYEELDENAFSEESYEDEDEYDDESLSEDGFLKDYIGEDYNWIVEKPFNIYALLLSWMYFLYRKLYIIGIIGLAITGYVLRVTPNILPIYIIIVMVLSGILFNPIYLIISKIKVANIVNRYSDKSNQEIREICADKGGVNTPRALLIFLIFLIIMLFTYIHFGTKENKPSFWKENTENNANCILITKEAYSLIEKSLITGSYEESACEVKKEKTKNYDIYFKIRQDNQYRYIYVKNEGKYLTVKGDTKDIEKLEKDKLDKNILKEEETMLEVSKALSKTYSDIKRKSEEEQRLIDAKKNTSERLHYIYTKDDIFK